ncbi:MAG: acyl carrier protein [Planctomycetes bacterium]|nr:acyl carrier protein [Planctomycetota bacterium]
MATQDLEQAMLRFIAGRRRCPPTELSPELPFNELGIDSLDAMTLAAELEETLGRPVDPGLLFDHPTPRALACHLAGR